MNIFPRPNRFDRITLTWGLLTCATIISWLIGHESRVAPHIMVSSVLMIAFIKVRYVGLEFMELREAPFPMRAAFEIWTFMTCCMLVAMAWV